MNTYATPDVCVCVNAFLLEGQGLGLCVRETERRGGGERWRERTNKSMLEVSV